MSAHYCKVCGKHSPGDAFLFDKDSNDLCVTHGQELLEKLEAEVERLREGILTHKKEWIESGGQDYFAFDQDKKLWKLLETEAGGADYEV